MSFELLFLMILVAPPITVIVNDSIPIIELQLNTSSAANNVKFTISFDYIQEVTASGGILFRFLIIEILKYSRNSVCGRFD